MDTSERNLEIVRQTAEILSSGSSLSETFERFCLMLAQFIDASVVFVAVKRGDGAYIDFAYDHGSKWRDTGQRIQPASQTQFVLDSGEPVLIRTLGELRGPLIPLKSDDDSQSAMFVPLRFGAETIGVLSAQTTRKHAYDEQDLHLLQTCALYVAVAAHAEAVRSEKELLQTVALRDALTGVANRRTFDQRLRDDWAHAQREGSPLALLVLDVDWFKRFNDTYGHIAGDACLNQVAQAAQSCIVRESDLFARYGGEEFTAILWSTEAEGALVVADRILAAVRALDIPHAESPLGRVTVSIGVASAGAASLPNPQLLVQAADRALYAAKTAGRDRAVMDSFGAREAGSLRRPTSGNLRAPTTPLLGRTAEIAALAALLKSERIVTVAGKPGVGKSRVATAAAQRRLYAYPDGAWVVELASTADGSALDALVLSVMGIPQRPDAPPRETLLDELQSKTLLLVLEDCAAIAAHVRDTCEALVHAAPLVTALLVSDAPVGAYGERVFTLGVPGPVDAAALFIERAQAASATLSINDGARALVERICARLDNVPLAIELTAAHARAMSLDQILLELDHGEPGADPLESAIAWSCRSLSPCAARLFERLSCFPGDFGAQAVRDICGGVADLDPWDVPEALDELAAASLLRTFDFEGTLRYDCPRSLRETARAAFEIRAEARAVRSRFIGYFRALAGRAAERIEQGRVEEGVNALAAEAENVHAALEYAFVEGIDLAGGTGIVVAMRRFWSETGRLAQGRYWIDMALRSDLPPGTPRADLVYAAALMAHYNGDMVRLASFAEELVAYYETMDDPDALAKALNGLANARFRLGDLSNARALYGRAIDAYRKAGNSRGAAVVMLSLGSLAAEYDADTATARRYYLESLTLFRALGVSMHVGSALSNLAGMAIREGDYDEGLAYANEALAIFQRLGNHANAAAQLMHIAHARLERGEFGLARDALAAAREKLRLQPTVRGKIQFFEVEFLLAFATGADRLAAELLGVADQLRIDGRAPRLLGSSLEAAARERELERRMGPAEFERHRSAGRASSGEEMYRLLDTVLTR